MTPNERRCQERARAVALSLRHVPAWSWNDDGGMGQAVSWDEVRLLVFTGLRMTCGGASCRSTFFVKSPRLLWSAGKKKQVQRGEVRT